MKYFLLLSIILIALFPSCKKKNNIDIKIKLLEQLNGNYTGNIYKWHRDFDSTQTNIVETFDTVLNVSGNLEIDVESNSIKFSNVPFIYHDELSLLLDQDTITARYDQTTLPSYSIKIIKSLQFVQVYTTSYSPTGGPYAYSITENYYKN